MFKIASISGYVYYQQNSYAEAVQVKREIIIDGGKTKTGQYIEVANKVPGVAITLYDDINKKGITVTTSSTTGKIGYFQITDIPKGTYKLIETFGFTAQQDTTASFSKAVTMSSQPLPSDPTVEHINTKGFVTKGATKIVSLSRNVIPFTISDSNLNSSIYYEFIDAPRIMIPLQIREYGTTGSNLIKSVAGGTFGTEKPGTLGGTSNSICPYTKYTSGAYTSTIYDSQFYDNYKKYTAVDPNGSYFTICNIANLHTFTDQWFDTPSKMQGDETGRFLIVNGHDPNNYFFKETVTVQPKKDYIFSAWIMNIYRVFTGALPLFKVVVTDSSDKVLFNDDVSIDNPLNITEVPTWKQIGAILSKDLIGTKTELTIKFISMGIETVGNDYCVDDISLLELEKSELKPTLTKSTYFPTALENQPINYFLTLTNVTSAYIYDLVFIDPLPYGSVLYSNEMTIKVNSMDGNIAEFKTTIDANSLSTGINMSKLIGNEIAYNQSKYASNPYFSDLRDGRLPRKLSVEVMFIIKVPNAQVLSSDKIIRNTGKYEYSSPLDSDNQVPRIVFSNEVITEIISPKLSYIKEASIFENGEERILENCDGMICGQVIAYRIVITNTVESTARNVEITDYLDENLIPIYSESDDCANGISVQDISPIPGEERFLTCSEIIKIEGSIYNIKIPNITVPTAWMDENDELKVGQCVVRIYCRVKCDDEQTV